MVAKRKTHPGPIQSARPSSAIGRSQPRAIRRVKERGKKKSHTDRLTPLLEALKSGPKSVPELTAITGFTRLEMAHTLYMNPSRIRRANPDHKPTVAKPAVYMLVPKSAQKTAGICRHCHKRTVSRPRGLCYHCYYTPGVTDLYPSKSKFARRGLGNSGRGKPASAPTDAPPGSRDKMAVMHQRLLRGESLFHQDDNPTIDPRKLHPFPSTVIYDGGDDNGLLPESVEAKQGAA